MSAPNDMAASRMRWIERSVLALLVFGFILLALRTIFQCEYYPSERNVLGPAELALGHTERFRQKYPPFSAYFYYLFIALRYRVGWIGHALPSYGIARVATLLLSCVSLCLLWRVARRIGGWRYAILSAYFLAANHTFFALSQLAHPEALLTFLVIVELYLSIGILKTGKTGYYIGAALVAAAAISTKYFVLALVLPVAAHLLEHHQSGRSIGRTLLSPKLGLLILVTGAAIPVMIPGLRQFITQTYPTIRNDGYFTNDGPCCLRLPQSGMHRTFVWPALVLLPYCVGLLGYLSSLAGMVTPLRTRSEGEADPDRKNILRLLLIYVVVVFVALQLMTPYFLPQAFTALFPVLALFSACSAEAALRWTTSRFSGGRRIIMAAVALAILLGATLPGIRSVTAFYRAISTNGNKGRALLGLATTKLAPTSPSGVISSRFRNYGVGFDMIYPSEAVDQIFSRAPYVLLTMDCFVENVRKRARADTYCSRLYSRLQAIRSEVDYVQVATITAPDWWGRKLYQAIDPEFSFDMRLYVHRSIYDPKAVGLMLDEFEQKYPRTGG